MGRMNLGPRFSFTGGRRGSVSRFGLLALLVLQAHAPSIRAELPKRLVLALDGIAYRDMKALQEGVTYQDLKGRQFHRQAFHQGYFPVSRLISTFPSASDVAWTEIFGNRPLPGYQRTYFSEAANLEVRQNGVTTTMEYERQMTWQVTSGFRRALGYARPRSAFQYEVRQLVRNFLRANNGGATYYALLRSPDDAQHLSADILALLCTLDEKLQELRTSYRAREGRELEILILSDHGNNHAGPAKRIEIRPFLKKAGYRLSKSIQDPKDVVLPTTGIESWVEIHNSPGETERLVQLLSRMQGVDVLTARDPEQPNHFIVMNSKGERASIMWNPVKNSFRYTDRAGDPINYLAVVDALSKKKQLDADGFAPADAWTTETMAHRYPLALERIVRGHTRAALNAATILISLDNAHAHSGWFVRMGSGLVRFGGTHGALDDLNSNGILLSSFAPTQDTSANRVAAFFDGFKGMRAYRAEENGAEWVSGKAQALTTIARSPLDHDHALLMSEEVFLRIWTPHFIHLGLEAPVDVTVKKARQFRHAQIRRGDSESVDSSEQRLTFNLPVVLADSGSPERVYALPSNLILQPGQMYLISGRVGDGKRSNRIFSFAFHTDGRGVPVAY